MSIQNQDTYIKYVDPKTGEEKFVKSKPELLNIDPFKLALQINQVLLERTISLYSNTFNYQHPHNNNYENIISMRNQHGKDIYMNEKYYDEYQELLDLTHNQICEIVDFLGSTKFKLERIKEIENDYENPDKSSYFLRFRLFYTIWTEEITERYPHPIKLENMKNNELKSLSKILSSFKSLMEKLLKLSNINTKEILFSPDKNQEEIQIEMNSRKDNFYNTGQKVEYSMNYYMEYYIKQFFMIEESFQEKFIENNKIN